MLQAPRSTARTPSARIFTCPPSNPSMFMLMVTSCPSSVDDVADSSVVDALGLRARRSVSPVQPPEQDRLAVGCIDQSFRRHRKLLFVDWVDHIGRHDDDKLALI